MPAMENDETLQLFLEEARDHLRDIETELLNIETETGPADVDLVNKVFRGIHSIKGAAGFFGLSRIKELSHVMENLLNRIRNLELVPTRVVIEALLRSADVLSAMVDSPENSESMEIESSLELLRNASGGVRKIELVPIALPDGRVLFNPASEEISLACKGGKNLFLLEFDMVADIDRKGKSPVDLLKELEKTGLIIDAAVDHNALGEILGSIDKIPFFVVYATVLDVEMTGLLTGLPNEQIHSPSVSIAAVAPVSPAATKAKMPRKKAGSLKAPEVKEIVVEDVVPASSSDVKNQNATSAPGHTAPQSSSLRVNVRVLDRLMTLAGELVLSRNQLVQKVGTRNLTEIQASSQGLSMIISELQEAVMSTRMQPLSIVFAKFQRVVRDLAGELGKEIRLDIEGEDVELDKAVIESIGDPLTHLVRNSVDHGIEESPDHRQKYGKPRQATVKLRAYHEAGKVVIEVSDDGRGIDTERIREKALEKKLVDPQHLAQMGEKDLVNLIFMPGFSTAQTVTDISGRGVGMDVVKTNFTRLGGVIDIETKKGKGTRIRVKLPLTLAIIPSLLCSVQEEIYAIPQVSLVELVRVPAREVRNRIERLGDALVMRLRGRLLPIVRLTDVLGISQRIFRDPETGEVYQDRRQQIEDRRGPQELETQAERDKRRGGDRRYHSDSAVNILVLSAGTFQYGLIVDRLHESEEIVVKPLGLHFNKCACYAGATILGDGRVSLILDVVGISRHMKLADVGGMDHGVEEEQRKRLRLRDAQSLLLFRVAEHEQFAVPLALVSRLEVISRQAIEEVGGRRTMQYRGGSLPLLDLADVAQVAPLPAQDSYFVIVYSVGGREVGLLVSQIVDILEASVEFDEMTFRQNGVLGSSILAGSTTLLVDLYGVVQGCLPGWISGPIPRSDGRRPVILVADDSPFYLRQITNFLKEAGYEIIEAVNGDEALARLELNPNIELLLTDIEMPVMDGLELTRRIRAHETLRELPVVAITSLSGEDALRRGQEAGLDGYLIKLDRETILQHVENFINKGRRANAA